MIKILGAKRVFLLLGLLAVNVLLAASLYLFFIPNQASLKQQLSASQSRSSTLQTDIQRMQMEFDQLETQRAEFEALKARGFFNLQDRRQAELMFTKIQRESSVIAAAAKISAGVLETNEEAQKANYKLLVSNVTVDIKAIDDVDVYKYIYLIHHFFPGHVTIKKIDMERKAQINGTILRAVSSGQNPELVAAKIEMEWRTMVPDSGGGPPP